MLLKDIQYTIRQWVREPTFAIISVLTLAIGIAACTTIFSFVSSLLLRPFPFRDPDQLVQIDSVRGGEPGRLSMREILDMEEQIRIIEGLAARTTGTGGYNYSGDAGGKPEEWPAVLNTANLFDVLGVSLAAGAPWPKSVDRERDYRVILSHRVWQRVFGGRPDIVGQKISLDHAEGYEIHGVAPRGFDYPFGVQVYRSVGGFASSEDRQRRNLVGIARIRKPHTVAELQAQLDGLAIRLAQQYPATNQGQTFRATPFRELYSGNVRPYLVVLGGAVATVLLIACANVVNLLLGRALGREREIAVRLAIGAGRGTLFRQLLTESALLGLAAGTIGLALAWACVVTLRSSVAARIPEWMSIDVDWRVPAFAVLVSLLAGMAAGIAPALQACRNSPSTALREGSRGSSRGLITRRLRDLLIVGEVGMSIVLLAGAGLLIRGFLELQQRDKGFQSASLATFRVNLGWKRYTDQEKISRYYVTALDRLSEVPEFRDVAVINQPPLTSVEQETRNTVQAEHQSLDDALANPYVHQLSISEKLFDALRLPVLAGRKFTAFDGPSSELVAIVSRRLAERLWPGQDPTGKRLRYNPLAKKTEPLRTVVGVAGDVNEGPFRTDASLAVYVPLRQRAASNQYFIVRTDTGMRNVQSTVERVLGSLDHQQSVFDFATYDQRILDTVWQLRLSRSVLVLLAAIAVVLAAIGIYGVMTHLVGQRTREMGIRLALGAEPAEVRGLVVRRALLLGAGGVCAGVLGALLLGRALAAHLQGVRSLDPFSLSAVSLLLLGFCAGASAVPAWRAARVDPAVVLRQE